MTTRLLRSAAWAGLVIVSVLACTSCDMLNPAFVAQIGGNAGAAGPDPTGSIVVVFNNQRTQLVGLDHSVESSPPGEQTRTHNSIIGPVPTGFWTVTYDCNTTKITINKVVPATQISTTQPDQGLGESLGLDGMEFARPALQCGAVLFVNVPLVGPPTADLVP